MNAVGRQMALSPCEKREACEFYNFSPRDQQANLVPAWFNKRKKLAVARALHSMT